MRTRIGAVLAIVLAAAAPAAWGAVEIHRDAAAYHVTGEFEVAATASAAWAVITDYDGISRFVSSVKSSRVLRREPGRALIEQEVTGSVLFFSRRIKLRLWVTEQPPDRVSFEQVEPSPFALYEGSWTIESTPKGCRVAYELAIDPESAAPGFIAEHALVRNVSRQLDDVRAEIARRAGAQGGRHG